MSDVLFWSYETVAMPELVWTVVAILATLVSLRLIDHMADTRDVLFEKPHLFTVLDFAIMRRLAESHLKNEWLRVGAHSISIVLGVILMMVPPANPDRPVTIGGWLVAAALCAKAGLHMGASLKDWYVRESVIEDLKEEERRRASHDFKPVH